MSVGSRNDDLCGRDAYTLKPTPVCLAGRLIWAGQDCAVAVCKNERTWSFNCGNNNPSKREHLFRGALAPLFLVVEDVGRVKARFCPGGMGLPQREKT